jgi:hypothetical protein
MKKFTNSIPVEDFEVLTDTGFEALVANGRKFSKLQDIFLSNNQITDAGLEALAANGSKFVQL